MDQASDKIYFQVTIIILCSDNNLLFNKSYWQYLCVALQYIVYLISNMNKARPDRFESLRGNRLQLYDHAPSESFKMFRGMFFI